jgi:hypothetical protein
VKLDRADLAECFTPQRFLRNSGVVFERLEALVLGTAYL